MDELILEKLLEGPFSHFKQVGQDDWRDPHEKNSSLSLSNRGYYDHRTGCCGSLLELGKSYHLSGLEKFSDSSRVPLTQKIWEKSHLAKNADTPAFQLIKSYFTGHRSIPLHGYDDLLKVGLIRLNEYQGERMIVYPSLAPQDAQDAICSRYYEVNRIQRIFLNGDGSQKEKKHLGSTGNAAAGFLIPPLNDDQGEKVVLVVEGLEDALSIRIHEPPLWILVGNDKAGLRKLDGFFTEQFKNCMIIADHDTDKDHAITGQAEAWRLGQALKKTGMKEVTVQMPKTPKDDANKALAEGRYGQWFESLMNIPERFQTGAEAMSMDKELPEPEKPALTVLSLSELLNYDVAPRSYLLEPWLPEQGLVMIYAARDAGKTWFALWLANAVSLGRTFIKWTAPRPRKVLYIDGEMPLSMMKERMGKIVADNQSNNDCIYFINPDTQENGISNLATTKGQQEVDVHIKDYDLIILDNLSTLLRSGKENEGESWLPIQEWALRHRSKGKSMVFIHHAGKSGQQRGTSRREDVLDTVIALKRPSDFKVGQDLRFEVHFEKARGLYGKDVEPIECYLRTDEKGNLSWTHRTIEESTHQKVINMYKEGLNQTEITQELDVNKSVVSRHLKRAREQDELSM